MKRLIGRTLLRLFGWETVPGPKLDRCVIVLAPHTSNWDFVIGLAVAFALELEPNWLGKDSLFRFPFGGIMRWLGGFPVDRRTSHDMVAQVVAEFGRRQEFRLALSPEGTRACTEYWKSGFYYVARGARVPVQLAFLDYGKKRGGLGPVLNLTGDVAADMQRIAAFFANVEAKDPAAFGPVRIKA